MPRNVSGSYSLPGAVNPVVTNDLITANWANTTLNDIATALTNSLDRTGNGAMQAQLRLFDTGGAAAPPLAFAGDTNTGLYPVAADQLGVSLGGTLAATFAGNAFTLPNAVIPTWAGTPSAGSHLVNKTYTDATFMPAAGNSTLRGNLTLLREVSVTAVAAIDFVNGVSGVVFDSTYEFYVFQFVDLLSAAGAGVSFSLRTSTDAGATWDSGAGAYYGTTLTMSLGSSTTNAQPSTTFFPISGQSVNVGPTGGLHGWLTLFLPYKTTSNVMFQSQVAFGSSGGYAGVYATGVRGTNADVDGVRFLWSAGSNFQAQGLIRLYGVRRT